MIPKSISTHLIFLLKTAMISELYRRLKKITSTSITCKTLIFFSCLTLLEKRNLSLIIISEGGDKLQKQFQAPV